MNQELPDVQTRLRKDRGTRDQIANICWIIKKARDSRKTSTFASLAEPFTMRITTNWKILKEMRILDHLACFLRSLYACQEAIVRIGQGTMDWLKIGKGIQGCILSPCLFNLNAEDIM